MAGISAIPSWTPQFLESMRREGDPAADNAIAEILAQNDIGPVNDLMRNLVANEYPPPGSLPPGIGDYFARTEQLPEWADETLIRAGERVFWCYGPQLILILNCYSLPFCYLGRNGVQALSLTTRLVSNPTRRVLETAQMLVDVMQPGGLTTPQGRGRRTLQKVRLMHGAIRRLAAAAPAWKSEYGLPVNQEDLAGTLMSFSWVALDGLAKLGCELPAGDCEAYLHCWRVVGSLLGIRDDLLPANMDGAAALTQCIAQHEFGPTPEGQELTRALIEMIGYILPGRLLDHAAPALMRYFLGQQWAASLGIEQEPLGRAAAAPLRLLGVEFSELLRGSKAARNFAEHVGHLLIESIVYVERGGNRPAFSIPAELRQQWGVNWR